MTINIDVNEAKTNLEQMLQQVRQGESAIITENGVAIAHLVPCPEPPAPRKTLGEIKDILIAQKPMIQEKYHVSELGIFGSYVRGEETDDSDIDVLVEFAKTPGLLKFIGLENDLSDRLEMKVDLVHKAGLKPTIGDRILAEVIYLFPGSPLGGNRSSFGSASCDKPASWHLKKPGFCFYSITNDFFFGSAIFFHPQQSDRASTTSR